MTNIALHVIQKCGGPKVVAAWTGKTVATVYRWTYPKDRGGTGCVIPADEQAAILRKAQKAGIDLSPNDFFDTSGEAA